MPRAIREWLRSLTDIRRAELVPTGLMFLYGFLALTSYYVLKPVRNSVFVDRVGADNLPHVYLLTAVLVGVAMVGYSRWVDRVERRTLLLGTFAFLALNLIGFRWWLGAASDSFVASGAFYIWGKLYHLLLVSQFYLVDNLLFTTRQARRLFGFIGIGLILGGVAGSSISGWTATVLGTGDLLLIAAGILLSCGAIVVALVPRMALAEGGSARLFYIVVEGKVEAQRGDRRLFTAEPAETVGDLSLLDGLPRNYRAVADTDARVLVLPREEFYALAARRFRIARDVLSHLARVVRALNARAAEGEPLPRTTVESRYG